MSSSGVRTCNKVLRTTTLTMSQAPLAHSNTADRIKLRDTPNPIMHRPNPATANSNVRPVRSNGGQRVNATLEITAPRAGAARKIPRPCGPTCKISAANTGSNAIAPPNSTENKSRVIAPRMTGSPRTNRKPLVSDDRIFSSLFTRGGATCRIDSRISTAVTISATSTAYASVVPPTAYNTPPSAGPNTAPNCQDPLRHVIAFGYNSRGNNSALSDWRAGCRNARAMPLSTMTE